MDLKQIANSGGYGTGKAAIERQREKDERRAFLPDPMLMATLYARPAMQGYMVASFGHCPETDNDWVLEHESELGLVDGTDSTASMDARLIAAVWNAFRDGELVLASDT